MWSAFGKFMVEIGPDPTGPKHTFDPQKGRGPVFIDSSR